MPGGRAALDDVLSGIEARAAANAAAQPAVLAELSDFCAGGASPSRFFCSLCVCVCVVVLQLIEWFMWYVV